MADPIARAINTFAALKGMDQRQEQLDQAREDRLFSRDMMSRQEARADETFNMNKAANAKNSAWQEKERGRTEQGWAQQDLDAARQRADETLLSFTQETAAAGIKEWGPTEVSSLMSRLENEGVVHGLKPKLAALYDPKKVAEREGATLEMLRQLKTGDINHDTLLENANIAFADELDARGQKYGAKQIRFSRLVPSPQGDGFMGEVEVTRADGSKDKKPLTMNGGTAEDGDNEVKVFKMEQVAPYLVGKLLTYRGAKAYLESRGKITPKEGADYKTFTDAEGRVYAYDPKNPKDKQLLSDATNPLKDGKGGSGGKSGKGGLAVDNDAYKLFDDQLNKQFLSEFQASLPAEQKEMADMMETDALGNQRVDMQRVVSKMPKEMRDRYNAARQVGENFMADGSLAPILAANKAYGYTSQPKGEGPPQGPQSQFTSVDPKNPVAVKEVSQFLATLPAEEYAAAVQEMEGAGLVDLARALQLQRGAGQNTATAGAPRTRGMTPETPQGQATSPVAALGQMRANIPADNALTRVNEYPVKVIQAGLNQLANYFVMDPARAAASDIAKPFKAFQAWAQNRYKTPDAVQNPQALAEYAQVDPQGAQQIQQAAVQFTQ
jgi:hypothetical protein